MKQFNHFYQILFIIFVFAIPFQTRTIINPAESYLNSYFSYHETIFFYLTDLLFLGFFVPWLIFDRAKNLNGTVFLKILAYLSLIFITLFHVKRLDLGLFQALKWVEMLGLTIFVWKNASKAWLFQTILAALYITSIFQAILGILQFHVQHSLNLGFLGEYIAPLGTPGLATIEAGEKLIRAYGTMPHPNVLGGFLVIGLIIGLFYVSSSFAKASAFVKTSADKSADRRETWFHAVPARASAFTSAFANPAAVALRVGEKVSAGRLATAGGTIVLILGIFFTFSRVAWFSGFLAILGFAAFNLIAKNKNALALIFIILIVSCGTIFAGYQDLAKARISEGSDTAAVKLRADFNQMGIEIIKKYPLLGVGVGNYTEAQKDLFDLDGWQHQPPHNIYIYLAAELGLLGLGLFLVIIFDILKQAWPFIRKPLGFTVIIAAVLILVMGMFDHYLITIQQGRLIFFAVLGMLAAAGNFEQTKNGD